MTDTVFDRGIHVQRHFRRARLLPWRHECNLQDFKVSCKTLLFLTTAHWFLCVPWTVCTTKTSAKAQIPPPPVSSPVLLLWLQEWTGTQIKTFMVSCHILSGKVWNDKRVRVHWPVYRSDPTGQYLPEFRYNTAEALPYIPQPANPAVYNR